MKIENPHKESTFASQSKYFKGLNPSSDEFKEKMQDGGFQRNPEQYKSAYNTKKKTVDKSLFHNASNLISISFTKFLSYKSCHSNPNSWYC